MPPVVAGVALQRPSVCAKRRSAERAKFFGDLRTQIVAVEAEVKVPDVFDTAAFGIIGGAGIDGGGLVGSHISRHIEDDDWRGINENCNRGAIALTLIIENFDFDVVVPGLCESVESNSSSCSALLSFAEIPDIFVDYCRRRSSRTSSVKIDGLADIHRCAIRGNICNRSGRGEPSATCKCGGEEKE